MTSSTGTNPRAAGLVARERLEQHGVNTLSDAELLAIAHFTRALDGAERGARRRRPGRRRRPSRDHLDRRDATHNLHRRTRRQRSAANPAAATATPDAPAPADHHLPVVLMAPKSPEEASSPPAATSTHASAGAAKRDPPGSPTPCTATPRTTPPSRPS